MNTDETGFEDVTFDLISTHYRLLKAGYDYGQYADHAEHAGRPDIAVFFRHMLAENAVRTRRCREFLQDLGISERAGPTEVHSGPARHHTPASGGRQR